MKLTKNDFINELKHKTKHLTKSERKELISYYTEMISERMDDGMSEEEAIAALGSVDELLASYAPAGVNPRKSRTPRLRVWHILLIILGSPVWISLLMSFLCVLLCFYIVIWALVLVFYVVFAALAVCSLAFLIMGFVTLLQSPAYFFFCLGASCVLAGVAVLWLIVCNLFAKAMAKLTKVTSKGIFKLFFKR